MLRLSSDNLGNCLSPYALATPLATSYVKQSDEDAMGTPANLRA